jgi:hypothetical protein
MQRFLSFWTAVKLRSSRRLAWYQDAPKARDLLHLVEILAVAPLFFDLRRNPVGILALSLTTRPFGSWMGSLNHDSLIRQTTYILQAARDNDRRGYA